jgi:uncharacterized protein|tara:strand:+ start:1505 stop:1948 length:444 start_codon:yes stop_codon:yes gene_type:complete
MLELNTLRINIAQQLKANTGAARDYMVKDMVDIADSSRLVQGKARLTRTDRGILVQGTLHIDVESTCSRCLSVFSYPLTLNIVEEYFPQIDIDTGNTLPSPEDYDSFTIDENNVLDLLEAVRQYALLSVPMKPLCRTDCAGLILANN